MPPSAHDFQSFLLLHVNDLIQRNVRSAHLPHISPVVTHQILGAVPERSGVLLHQRAMVHHPVTLATKHSRNL